MKFVTLAIAVVSISDRAAACTTLVVGKRASADGSVLLSHSDDSGAGFDARLCFVPGLDHAEGSLRPVYFAQESFPRHIGTDRGDCYLPQAGETPYEPIGYIPEVKRTFGIFEATYGLLNEKGVGMGESTCSGVFGTKARGHGGQALFSIDALSRVSLERAATARDAITIMGSLAEEYGFYGEGTFEGSAESLMVGDADEAFMFHILPDPDGTSAIWVARRVPDDEVGVTANMFVIREVDFNDEHNYLFSESVRTVAQEKGWWTTGEPLDFTKIYSDGEYAHKFYSGRRVWGAYRLFGQNFSDDYEDLRYNATYPVTAKPGQPITVNDLFRIHRDHYEGTKYDMTQGLAAGPWADPDRWSDWNTEVQGSWERSIGLFRTSETHVVQARKADKSIGSLLWYGPHNADATVFLPVPQSATEVPESYKIANPNVLNRTSAYWAHKYVFNIAKMKYSYAMEDVKSERDVLEAAGAEMVADLDEAMPGATTVNQKVAELAQTVLSTWWGLPDTIVSKYADGFLNDGEALGYPDWWLRAVGYENGPPPPPSQTVSSGSSALDVVRLEQCVRSCPVGDRFAPCMQSCQARAAFLV